MMEGNQMGWAKYLEDNISIYNDRMYLKECIVEYTPVQQPVKRQAVAKPINVCKAKNNKDASRITQPAVRTRRCGLELKFPVAPEKTLVRKLQLNGWWWSNNASSWCNLDTEANRKYARTSLKEWRPILVVFAAC